MRPPLRTWLLAASMSLSGFAIAADDPNGKTTAQVLAAMDHTSTWGHPDQYHEFVGMHCYVEGNYPCAMDHFLQAARFADKLSQLSIGLMYLDGQGVQRDRVAAFAWVAIAAERKYPRFLATRDQIWAGLDGAQRQQARTLVDGLYSQYGDAVAKPRLAKVLRRTRTEMTGSYVGYGSSATATVAPGFGQSCSASTIDGAPATGCGGLYAEWRWNPKLYFASRDAAWTGTVTVGPLQQVRRDGQPAPAGNK